MAGTFILRDDGERLRLKEIKIFDNPHGLKLILDDLSWKILCMLYEKELYPLEIAKTLGVHEQKVYYHIKKLVKAGVVTVVRREERKGAIAKYYRTAFPAFGLELPYGYRSVDRFPLLGYDLVKSFFAEFIDENGCFSGKIVVGSPLPHGPFRTSARDGHYASHLTFFIGQFCRMPREFAIKLDVDVKAEKEEKNNIVLVGGPGTNLLTQEINNYLPVRFNIMPSDQGFLLGGLASPKTGQVYTADTVGIIAKVVNPWDSGKRIIVLAGNKAVGTKACVLALTGFWEKILEGYDCRESFVRVVQGLDLNGDGKVDSVEIIE